MRFLPAAFCLLLAAACAPPVYHQEAQRPLPASGDALSCAAGELARLGYAIQERDPDSGRIYAKRLRPRGRRDRFDRSDWLDVQVTGSAPARSLVISAATLEGGEGGVAPRFRAPLGQTVTDRDTLLEVCSGRGS